MPVFKDQENKSFELPPEGDHVFCVEDFESGIQTGSGKTAGSPFWELKLLIETNGSHCWERLIDHSSCDFKIDCFLKSTGVKIPKGQAFEFDHGAAAASGAAFVDIIGLRGWLCIRHEDYTPPGKPAIKRAKVSVFYTDKPKLPRRLAQPAQPQSAPEPDPLSDGPF